MKRKDIMSDVKYGIVLGIILLLGAAGVYLYYTQSYIRIPEPTIKSFPQQVGAWQSRDIALTRRIFENLQTDNVLLREYTDSQGNTVNLYIVYSADNRKVSHPPEICIQGSGSTITERQIMRITGSITATRLIIENRNLREMEVFWYKVGPTNTNSYIQQQLEMVLDRMAGKRTAIALVRVSTSITDTPATAYRRIKQFCQEIEPYLTVSLP